MTEAEKAASIAKIQKELKDEPQRGMEAVERAQKRMREAKKLRALERNIRAFGRKLRGKKF